MGHYSQSHRNPALMDACDDTDEQTQWFLARKDLPMLEYAIYRLPPHMLSALAGVVRAYYQHNELGELLADSREEFLDDMRTARIEG